MAFARNGVIVDKEIIDLFEHISDALKALAAAIEQVEARLQIVEDKSYTIAEWEKIMIDLGFEQ